MLKQQVFFDKKDSNSLSRTNKDEIISSTVVCHAERIRSFYFYLIIISFLELIFTTV